MENDYQQRYDVALSFANEDRQYVERVARGLLDRGARLFHDALESQNLWGKELYPYLADLYSAQSRLTIIFVSRHYVRKQWTNQARVASQARAFAEHPATVLLARFDDTEVPSILESVAYIDLTILSPEQVADLIVSRLAIPSDRKGGNEPENKWGGVSFGTRSASQADGELPLLLYSVVTSVAFRINEQFYRSTHYAWCAPYFDMRRNQVGGIGKSPPSSNPFELYASFLRDARAGDLHSALIRQNKDGILRGASVRCAKGYMTEERRNEIARIIDLTVASDYTPLIYVIPTHGLETLIKPVEIRNRAHQLSPEFILEDLPRSKFDIITTEDPLVI